MLTLAAAAARSARWLALLLPVACALAVWWPLRDNYFNGDDFFHLYDIVTLPLGTLLRQVWGGHLLVLYNAVFWAMFQAFGPDPRGFFTCVLLTHLLNTALLYIVVRRLTGRLLLASAGALVWGTAPILAGALGWYSVFGQVLLTTLVLLVLAHLARLLERGAPLTPTIAAWWTVVLAAGATAFGMGLGVAAAFPVAALVALPAAQRPRRAALVLLVGGAATVAAYLMVLTHWLLTGAPAREAAWIRSSLQALREAVAMTGHLLAFGTSALLLDVPERHQAWPPGMQALGGALLAGLVAAAVACATPSARRRIVALALLAAAPYAAVAGGRAKIYDGLQIPLTVAATAPRYHYLAVALLTLLACTVLAALASRGRWLERAVGALAGAALVVRVAALVTAPFPIDHWAPQRAEAADLVADVLRRVAATPPGEGVRIQNRPFGASGALPHLMPGHAGMFVVYFPDNTVDGRPVRFVVSDEDWARAQARGGRIAALVEQR